MPRKSRSVSQTGVYHVFVRGINKQTIFEDERDYVRYIRTLYKYKRICNFELYAYCLMGNHLHLLLKEGDERIDQIMGRINGSYVFWYNQRYERIGKLFQDRFGSIPVDKDFHLLSELRYIFRNPVKAGLAKHPIEYPWSNYQDFVMLNRNTDIDPVFSVIGGDLQYARNEFLSLIEQDGPNQLDQREDSKDLFRSKETISDHKAKEIVRVLCGTDNISDFQRIEPQERNTYLRELKTIHKLSIRQLVRITGVSRGVIARA